MDNQETPPEYKDKFMLSFVEMGWVDKKELENVIKTLKEKFHRVDKNYDPILYKMLYTCDLIDTPFRLGKI